MAWQTNIKKILVKIQSKMCFQKTNQKLPALTITSLLSFILNPYSTKTESTSQNLPVLSYNHICSFNKPPICTSHSCFSNLPVTKHSFPIKRLISSTSSKSLYIDLFMSEEDSTMWTKTIVSTSAFKLEVTSRKIQI